MIRNKHREIAGFDGIEISKVELFSKLREDPLSARREINNRSLFAFVEYFWDVISNDDFVPNWHIEVLCKELMEAAERVGRNEPKEYDIIINIPPGMTKTIICSIMFPAWCWTRWFWMRFITGSYSGALSLESAESSRDLIRSEKFKMVYPFLQIKEDKDTKSNFKVQKISPDSKPGVRPKMINGGNRYSTSVGGTLTGFHAHIQIVDDPLNPKQALSETKLKDANHWVDQTLSTRKTDKKVTVLILIMQRLHEDDPSGHLLAKKGKKIRHICLPGEIINYRNFVKPQELIEKYVDDLLDPRRLGHAELKEAEADLGQYGYAGQIGQNPVPPGGGMFEVDHFQIIDKMPSDVSIIKTLRYWDKAGTEGGGCNTAGVKMAVTHHGKYIVMDSKIGHWAYEKREKIIYQTAVADGTSVSVWIEQEPGSGGKESSENTIRNLAGFVVRSEKPVGDKERRADPFSVQVNAGNVYLLRGDWNHEFIEEFRFFPFGKRKDQVDAASAGFQKLVSKRVAGRVI